MSRTIVVGTDFSVESDKALGLACEIARTLGARLELVHVHQPGTYVLPPPLDLVTIPGQADEVAHVQETLERKRRELETADLPVSTVMLTGQPATMLVERAKELDAFLVVVGSRGSTGLAHILLGSVAERVVRHAACPVLVVPQRS